MIAPLLLVTAAVGITGTVRSATMQVALPDPLYPDQPPKQCRIEIALDRYGVPTTYRMRLQSATCFDGKCRPLDVTLTWDAIGRYRSLEVPAKLPLTKKEHDPFTAADYQRLDRILSDRDSLLGPFPAELFAPNAVPASTASAQSSKQETKTNDFSVGANAVSPPTPDAVSEPTPLTIQEAVVPGAAYTSWVLWHWVNGPIVAKLRAETIRRMDERRLREMLADGDPEVVRFALELILETPDGRFRKECFRILETAGLENCRLALDYLERSASDSRRLASELIPLYGTNPGSTRLLYRYFESCQGLSPDFWSALAAKLQDLPAHEQVYLLDLLETRAKEIEAVRRQVEVLAREGDPYVLMRARRFLAEFGSH
ncbi:hypothetical protein JCM19992_14500 [Thermostilla marina]